MITEEHLRHWIKEINYQLTGIIKEISADKVIMKGINVGLTGENFVSFEYLQEKSDTIKKTLECIEWDIKNDKQKILCEFCQNGEHEKCSLIECDCSE